MTTLTAVGTPLPAAASVKKSPKQLPVRNFYEKSDVLTAEEKATVKKVRTSIMQLGGFGHRKIADLFRN